MKKLWAITERAKDGWRGWADACRIVWWEFLERRRAITERGTVVVPLDEYCKLLEIANCKIKALELLGQAQETIRQLRGVVASQQQILDKEERIGQEISQVLIDRMGSPLKLMH